MRVLHVAATYARGGIASSLWHLLPDLQSYGIELEIAGLYEIGLYGERLTRHDIRATNLQFGPKYDAAGFARFVKWLRREKFDLIHAHGWPAIFFVALAAQFLPPTRFFVTEHSVSNRRRRYNLKFFERRMYRRYDRIVSVSRAADKALQEWLPETQARSSVIYNGISFARLSEIAPIATKKEPVTPNNGALLLCASGSEYHKGADVLIDALASRKSKSEFALALAGAGRHDAELRERVCAAGLAARTHWLGYVPDIVTRMANASVFVVPSRREGCPMVILEAMAMGMPIVASAVGGVPELVRDHEDGLLVPAENPAALADALEMLLQNPLLGQALGHSARKRIQEFTARDQAERVAALYQGKT